MIECLNNSVDSSNTGKLLNVSIFRVMSMLMIILFHCMCFNAGNWSVYPCAVPNDRVSDVASFVVSLGLPFFFFISGFLFAFIYQAKNGYRDWKAFTINKLKRLILPTVTWTIIYLILLPFRYSVWDFISGIRHLWFLPTLFCIFIIARLCVSFMMANRKFYLDLIMLLALIGVSCAIHLVYWNLLIGKVSCYIGYFAGGMMFYKYRFTVHSKAVEIIMLLVLLCIHAFDSFYALHVSQIVLDVIVVLAICCLLFDLLSIVKLDKDSVQSRVLANLDKNSLGIYLVHQVLIMTIYQYTMFEESWLTFHPYIGPIILFVVIFLLSWAFAEVKGRLKLEPYL